MAAVRQTAEAGEERRWQPLEQLATHGDRRRCRWRLEIGDRRATMPVDELVCGALRRQTVERPPREWRTLRLGAGREHRRERRCAGMLAEGLVQEVVEPAVHADVRPQEQQVVTGRRS